MNGHCHRIAKHQMQNSDTELDQLRRKLKFRASHRGIKEMDLILGHFANQAVDSMGSEELAEFGALLELHDRDLMQWFTGEVETPVERRTDLFLKIKQNQLDMNKFS
jgi:antitoxin CptB